MRDELDDPGMTQPTLFDAVRVEPTRTRGHVPASSVEAYQRVEANLRVSTVIRFLTCWPYAHEIPTSAELARSYYAPEGWDETRWLLWIRRGLSDALRLGLVEHAGKRTCTAGDSLAVTWRVKSR